MTEDIKDVTPKAPEPQTPTPNIPERHFAINETLLFAVINYMDNRPYREVKEAMPALMSLKQVALIENATPPK